jgi:hypothetical protein
MMAITAEPGISQASAGQAEQVDTQPHQLIAKPEQYSGRL